MSEARLHCFPSNDEDFAAFVHATAARLAAGTGIPTAKSLAAALRERYEHATVHEQTLLGAKYRDDRVWYVYRDAGP